MGLNIRKQRSRKRVIFINLSITTLLITTIIFFYNYRSSDKIKLGENFTSKDKITNDSKAHSLYIDGWSHKSLMNNSLKFLIRDENGTQTEKIADFQPLNEKDYKDLLATNPEILETVLSYLITSSSDIKCEAGSCTIDGKLFDLKKLLAINYNLPLSSTYQSMGIENALYKIDISYKNTESITLISPDNSTISLTQVIAPMEPTPQPKELSKQSATLLGYSFGRAFILEPLWSKNKSLRWKSYALEDISFFINEGADIKPNPFMNGLGRLESQSLSALSDSLLTYITSPISGCGIISLCLPTIIESRVNTLDSSTKKICSTDKKAAYITVLNQDIETVLKGSFHIYGLWNGVATNSDSLLGYNGTPELSGGEVSFRNNLAILSNSRGEIFDFFGQRGQFGIDASEYTEKIYKLDNKFLKENFGNYFKFC
jgi:hypothetical protein